MKTVLIMGICILIIGCSLIITDGNVNVDQAGVSDNDTNTR